MVLLWSLVFAVGLLAAGVGAQAVRLLHERDGQIAQLQGRVETVNDDLRQTQNQLEAHKVLLTQAQQWIHAVSHGGDTITPADTKSSKPSANVQHSH